MKSLRPYIRITIHLSLLILAAILWDRLLKIAWSVGPWSGGNSYQDLACLRALEILCLLILWKGERLSILGPKATWCGHILWGTALGCIGWGAILSLQWGALHFFKLDLLNLLQSPVNDTPLITLLLAASVFGPLLEELFFRTFLWQQLGANTATILQKCWIAFGMIFAFTALHIQWDASLMNQLPQIGVWTICASISMVLMLWRKSILSAWILHGMANAVILWPK